VGGVEWAESKEQGRERNTARIFRSRLMGRSNACDGCESYYLWTRTKKETHGRGGEQRRLDRVRGWVKHALQTNPKRR